MQKLSTHQDTVDIAKNKTNKLFVSVIPRISSSLCFNEYIAIENAENESDLLADREMGEDYRVWFKNSQERIYSTRLQYDTFFPTITLRAETSTGKVTEQQKRLSQLSVSGSLSHLRNKYYTLHGYISSDGKRIFKIYLVKTADIVDYLLAGGHTEQKQNTDDGNWFTVIPVANLTNAGINVLELEFDSYDQFKSSKLRESLSISISKLRARYT